MHTIFGGLIGYSFGKSKRALKNPPKEKKKKKTLIFRIQSILPS
jgi:hypothetical protein